METEKRQEWRLTIPEMEVVERKRGKLELYAQQPLTEFVSFDWYMAFDWHQYSDSDGDLVINRNTFQLMANCSTLLILCKPHTQKEDLLRLLRKTIDMIERAEKPFQTLAEMRAARDDIHMVKDCHRGR